MLDWLFASPSERRLLGSAGPRSATPWVIAIMSFTIVVVAAAGLAIANAASLVSQSTESRYSVQLPAGANVPAAAAALRSAPGVTGVEAVPEREMRATLARWLGPQAAASSDLPVPALVNFDLQPGADVHGVEQRVKAIAPGASISAHREALGPLLRSLHSLQWLAVGLVLLLGAASAAAVVLAARGALDTHRSTIEVMHGIGATDVQVTRLFQRRIAIDALVGSIAGAAAAALVLLLLFAGSTLASDLTGGSSLSALDLVILALLPLALTVLATWVARTAVLSALRKAI